MQKIEFFYLMMQPNITFSCLVFYCSVWPGEKLLTTVLLFHFSLIKHYSNTRPMVVNYSDEAIILGLQQKKARYIMYLYREYFPVVRSIVERNSGTKQDVEDVFQDTLFVLYQRSQKNDLDLTCSLKTYFYAISKNIWLQRLERKYRLLYQAGFEVQEQRAAYGADDSETIEYQLERKRLYQKHFFNLPEDCQKLLRLCFSKTPVQQIIGQMRYKDANYVKTRKYLCKNMLRKKIMNDPNCQPFIHYEKT